MLERIANELGYRAATLRLLDEEKNQLQLKASHGLSETYLKKGAIDVSSLAWLAASASMRPSGFLTVGLLVLVATPILRVIGSTLAFLYERDWRYAAITFFVLVVVSLSLLLGQG